MCVHACVRARGNALAEHSRREIAAFKSFRLQSAKLAERGSGRRADYRIVTDILIVELCQGTPEHLFFPPLLALIVSESDNSRSPCPRLGLCNHFSLSLCSPLFFSAVCSAARGDASIKRGSYTSSFFSRYEILNCHCLSPPLSLSLTLDGGGNGRTRQKVGRRNKEGGEKRAEDAYRALTSAATCQDHGGR